MLIQTDGTSVGNISNAAMAAEHSGMADEDGSNGSQYMSSLLQQIPPFEPQQVVHDAAQQARMLFRGVAFVSRQTNCRQCSSAVHIRTMHRYSLLRRLEQIGAINQKIYFIASDWMHLPVYCFLLNRCKPWGAIVKKRTVWQKRRRSSGNCFQKLNECEKQKTHFKTIWFGHW